MRRESDISDGKRTGVGRRERDKILAGDVQPLPGTVEDAQRAAEQHRMHFVADELRESALASAAIEAFLVRVHKALERPNVTADELAALLEEADLDNRLGALDDALSALVRSIQSMIGAASALAVNKV